MKTELPAKQIDLDKRSWWKKAKQQFWENVLYQTLRKKVMRDTVIHTHESFQLSDSQKNKSQKNI